MNRKDVYTGRDSIPPKRQQGIHDVLSRIYTPSLRRQLDLRGPQKRRRKRRGSRTPEKGYEAVSVDIKSVLERVTTYETKRGTRHVRDVAYWGLPYGTPITPGMKPRKGKDRSSYHRETRKPRPIGEDSAAAPRKRSTSSSSTTKKPSSSRGKKTKVPSSERPHVDRSEENLWSDYWGIYGWDWFDEDRDPLTEEEFYKYRRHLAQRQSRELGITYYAEEGFPDLETWELVNSIVGWYEDRYPGMASMLPSWAESAQSSDFHMTDQDIVAFNRPLLAGGYSETQGLFEVYRGKTNAAIPHDFGEIVLNRSFFTENNVHRMTRMYRQTTPPGTTAYFSSDFRATSENHQEMTEENLARSMTIHHEIGHTLANIMFGLTKNEHSTLGPDEDVRQSFVKESYEILLDHGLVQESPYERQNRPSWMMGALVRDKLDTGTFNKAELSKVVSAYGSTNLHEMSAEVWSAYVHDDEVTAFVQDWGSMMERFLIDHLEAKG